MSLALALASLRQANRIDGTRASYRKDSPAEYAAVMAYLDGGPRPQPVTNMGIGLCLVEDERRKQVPPPPTLVGKFIHPTGSDSTGSGTEMNPWRSLGKLFENLAAGETGYVRGGTYPNTLYHQSPYILYGAGKGGGITIRAYPGEAPIVNGSWHLLADNVTVIGLALSSAPGNGAVDTPIWIEGGNVTFKDCDVQGYPQGSAFFLSGPCRNFTLLRCIVHDIYWTGVGNQPHGIYAADAEGLLVEDCIFRNIPADNCYGVQLYPQTKGTIIRRSTFDNCDGGVVLYTNSGTSCTDHLIENNTFQNGGSRAAVSSGGPGTFARNVVRNNKGVNNPAGNISGSGFVSSGWT